MKILFSTILLILLILLYTKCTSTPAGQAPLFTNIGTHNFSITTDSDLAQQYFNQGVIFTYGFNHEEAFRSFKEVARLDTNCAMAYWGMAYVLGPNINLPMDAGVVNTAYEAVQKAITLLDDESQKEKDCVMAYEPDVRPRGLKILAYQHLEVRARDFLMLQQHGCINDLPRDDLGYFA